MEEMENEIVIVQCEAHYNNLIVQLKKFFESKQFTNIIIRSTKSIGFERIIHFSILYSLFDRVADNCSPVKDVGQENRKKIIYLPYDSSLINNFIELLYNERTCLKANNMTEFINITEPLKLSFSSLPNSDVIELSIPERKTKFLTNIWNLRELNSNCDLLFLSKDFQLCHSHCEIISCQAKTLSKINSCRIENVKPMVIVVQNSPKHDIELIIEFCYKGVIKFPRRNLKSVEKIAKLLSMDDLLDSLKNYSCSQCSLNKDEENIAIERPPAKPRRVIVDLIKDNPNYGYCYIWHRCKCIIVHAVVMKTFCPFFAKVYESVDWKEKDVAMIINDFNYMEVKAVIDFIYMGEANLVVDECGINKELIHWLGLAGSGNSLLNFKQENEVPKEESINSENTKEKECSSFKSFTDTGFIQCDCCSKQFKSPRTFNNHYKKRHETPAIFKCEKCDKVFLKRCNLKRHENMHKSPEFQCDKCGKFYCNRDYLEEHSRSHTGDKPFICPVCFKRFTGKTGLNHHLRVHEKTRSDMFVCDMCGKEFSRQGLWGHMKTHSKEYKCNLCDDKNFATPSALKRHVKWVHEKHPPLKCTFCSNEYELKSLLQRHMMNEHKYYNGEFIKRKAYACEKCSQSFHTYDRLQKHILNRHNNKETLPCQYCGKVLSGTSAIKYHMRSHTGERPHTCSFCSKSFTRPDLLKKHMRLHTGERFVCPLCNKSFTSKHYLTEHSWTHNVAINIEQYLIKESNSKKSSAESSKVTITSIKQDQLFKCVECENIFPSTASLIEHQNNSLHDNKFKIYKEDPLSESSLEMIDILDTNDINSCQIVTEILHDNTSVQNQNSYGCCQVCFQTFYTIEDFLGHNSYCPKQF